MTTHYDLIGDIHGHAQKLVQLLERLGYENGATGYCHPTRQVIFLGDFIDRGEALREHRRLLDIVMTMVENGHALAVMGNHEFNALAFHTEYKGRPLRPHNDKNKKQHRAFLNEFEHAPEQKQKVLDFFKTLPLWLELDGLRVVHACWDQASIDYLQTQTTDQKLTAQLLIDGSDPEHKSFAALERVLKGVEVALPEGVSFNDKDGHPRNAVRVQWWRTDAPTLGDMALPFGVDIGFAAALPVPGDIPRYGKGECPCFVGHYWLRGAPAPLSDNVACLDYSVAKGGHLVAYRFDGERVLSAEKFVAVV